MVAEKTVLQALGVRERPIDYKRFDRRSLHEQGFTEREVSRLLAARLLAAEVARAEADLGNPIRTSADVAKLMSRLVVETVEQVVALGLDSRGIVRIESQIAKGGSDGCAFTPRDVLRPMIGCDRVVSIVLAHNHPSGGVEPSAEDRSMTARVADACRIVGVRLLDHVIVAAGGSWFSFRDAGLL